MDNLAAAISDTKTEAWAIFDTHHHVGERANQPSESTHDVGWERQIEDDYASRSKMMRSHGVAGAALMPSGIYDRSKGLSALIDHNAFVKAYQSSHREAFPVVFATIDITLPPDIVESLAERYLVEESFDGLVWHHRLYGASIAHPSTSIAASTVMQTGKVAAIHVISESSQESPLQVLDLVEQYPDLQILLLDAFSSPAQSRDAIRLASLARNLWFDTGCLSSVAHGLDEFVSTIGSGRLLLGTDYYADPPTYWHPFPIYEILSSPLSKEDKERILWKNAADLYSLSWEEDRYV